MTETNLRRREVYCPNCKIYTITDRADSKCDTCNGDEITVAYSLMDGERLNEKVSDFLLEEEK